MAETHSPLPTYLNPLDVNKKPSEGFAADSFNLAGQILASISFGFLGLAILLLFIHLLNRKCAKRSEKKRLASLPPSYSIYPQYPSSTEDPDSSSNSKLKSPRLFSRSWFRFDKKKVEGTDVEFCLVCHHRQDHQKCKRTYEKSRGIVPLGYCRYCDQRTDHVHCLWSKMEAGESPNKNKHTTGILGNGKVLAPPAAVLKS